MNLPGSKDYDPTLPWVSLLREDGTIACNLFRFVDDLRPTGPGRWETWKAGRRVASLLNWLGIQDAARKRRSSTQCGGAWTGSIIRVINGIPYVLVSEEKWSKFKEMMVDLERDVGTGGKVSRMKTEKIRGFVNYVAMTYPIMQPYMMGLHLTIDGWRPGREVDGWRMLEKTIDELK